jgi:hypothetical protein
MASVHIKTGASGTASPYWNAKLKGPDGTGWTLTTKLREKKPATRLAGVWERAAEVARNGHLTPTRRRKSSWPNVRRSRTATGSRSRRSS